MVTAGIVWRKIVTITGCAASFVYLNILLPLLGQLSPTNSYSFLLQADVPQIQLHAELQELIKAFRNELQFCQRSRWFRA